MMKKRFIELDDGLDFSIKHIESGEMFYDCESVVGILNELAEENTMLKLQVETKLFSRRKLEKENEQLKQRNDRQAKRLAELYELMAKKDWESLTEIIDDFKRCEEQLQRESGTYW